MSDDVWDDEAAVEQFRPPQLEGAQEDSLPSSTPVLWVPDPEQPSGWREYYIKPNTKPPTRRGIGFRKRGSR